MAVPKSKLPAHVVETDVHMTH